jgi:hypothetical protein
MPMAAGAGQLEDSEKPWKIAKAQRRWRKQQEKATKKAAKESESTKSGKRFHLGATRLDVP